MKWAADRPRCRLSALVSVMAGVVLRPYNARRDTFSVPAESSAATGVHGANTCGFVGRGFPVAARGGTSWLAPAGIATQAVLHIADGRRAGRNRRRNSCGSRSRARLATFELDPRDAADLRNPARPDLHLCAVAPAPTTHAADQRHHHRHDEPATHRRSNSGTAG